jgi:hypothetical protein
MASDITLSIKVPERPVLTIGEVAELCRVAEITIRRRINPKEDSYDPTFPLPLIRKTNRC